MCQLKVGNNKQESKRGGGGRVLKGAKRMWSRAYVVAKSSPAFATAGNVTEEASKEILPGVWEREREREVGRERERREGGGREGKGLALVGWFWLVQFDGVWSDGKMRHCLSRNTSLNLHLHTHVHTHTHTHTHTRTQSDCCCPKKRATRTSSSTLEMKTGYELSSRSRHMSSASSYHLEALVSR